MTKIESLNARLERLRIRESAYVHKLTIAQEKLHFVRRAIGALQALKDQTERRLGVAK